MKNGIDRLFDEMRLRGFAVYITENGFTPEPEEKEDEFVKLSAYEKLERELEKSEERNEQLRLQLLGKENLISLLAKDNQRLIAENVGLQELMSRMAAKEADERHSNV